MKQPGELLYVSMAMKQTLRLAHLVAQKITSVLLLGESGSGKDFFAHYIHDHSHRAAGPYLSVNCAAISAGLVDSELFGHERGSFTGAVSRKRGLLELAEGGTLVLNEIGELPLLLQVKLLTFLDTKKFTRVGGEKEISVNARIIAATNRDLKEEVQSGSFRRDLFYRLNVMHITVPPLRDRLEDVPILVQEFIAKLCGELQFSSPPAISPWNMEKLKKYHWPGNVRELRNVLERALIVSGGSSVDIPELGSPQESNLPEIKGSRKAAQPHYLGDSRSLELATSSSERHEPSQQMRKPTKLKKPTSERLAMIYERCLKDGQWTRADVAKVFGRKSSSTVSKWFPKGAGYEEGEEGRPSGDARDLEKLRTVIEAIMR